MMLAASLLTATQAAVSVFSPSRYTCKKRVQGSMFRYDPYCARVLPSTMSVAALSAPTAFVTTSRTVLTPVMTTIETPQVLSSPLSSATPAVSRLTSAAPLPAATPVVTAAAPAATTTAAAVRNNNSNGNSPRYVIVHFKHESVTFLAPFRISTGDLVVVEGARGENIGIVREIFVEKPSYAVPYKVLRRATDKDREVLASQRQREAATIKTTQGLVESLGLRAIIEDAEYQFDLNKLTIFVRRPSKNAFVDFRKLQRGLFREFRCRIWLTEAFKHINEKEVA